MIDHVGNFLGRGGRAAIVRRNALWAVGMIVGFALACTATLLVRPGAVTYVLGFPALVLVIITAIARLNDIPDDETGLRWQLRRLWLLSVMTGAAFLLFSVPTWPELLLFWGVAGASLTLPGQPPWHVYLMQVFKE